MMKTVFSVLSTLTNFVWWAGLFLACRIAVWLGGKPAWWTIPVALAAGIVWLGVRSLARKRELRLEETSDPALRNRMRTAWKRGRALMGNGLFRPRPPLYLFLDLTRAAAASTLELGDASDRDTGLHDDEFTWHRGPGAVWLDYHNPLIRNDAGRWSLFADASRAFAFAGVAVTLDASRIARGDLAEAAVLRQRLESLQASQRRALPVYLILDNVDRFYGLRSIASRLDPDRLSAPFGGIRDQARENSPKFFHRVIAEGVQALERDGNAGSPRNAAEILAPGELSRLEAPLIRFCRQVFLKGRDNPKGKAPWIRGLYFAASAPGGGDAVAPALSVLAAFRPVHETLPVQPWFLRDLLRSGIPADAPAADASGGGGVRRALSAQAAGALAACAVLSLLLTWSFLENRGVLLSARGRTAPPAQSDGLQPYLELAAVTRLKANGWTLPRFGMNEAGELAEELKRRYTESYFDLKTIPSIEHVQDAALAAAESSDPEEIGNSLLLLAVTREGIARNLGNADSAPGQSELLHALVNSLRLATPEDMRQLETYFDWAGRQDWMPETAKALAEFEKHIVDNAGGGDLSWLPAWVAGLPGLQAVDTSKVWSVPLADNSLSVVGPAWTGEGYAIAKGVLEAVAYDPEDASAWREKRDAFLAQYRLQAVERWRVAAAVLWSKFRRRIPDGEVREMLRQAARGDDPASRFGRLLRRHLMPMFADVDRGGNPDVAWLFLHDRLELSPPVRDGREGGGLAGLADRLAGAVRDLGSDEKLDRLSEKFGLAPGSEAAGARQAAERWRDALRRFGLAAESPEENFAAVRDHFRSWRNGMADASAFDPLLQAGREAEILHRHLRESAGSGAWDGLSPLAVHDYIRYLATRQAALHLDALWRETVFDPSHLAPGDEGDRLERLTAPGGALEKFLTQTASGFWLWDGDGLANAEWKRLPFMFDHAFLDFCRKALREKRAVRPELLELPLRVRAVDVGARAVERPVRVEFVARSGGGEQTIAFNNYRIAENIVWRTGGDASVTIRVIFPSVTASIDFSGEAGLRDFVAMFSLGEAGFPAELFPEALPVLRRLGVERIVVKARLENGDQLIRHLREEPFGLPRSVIVPGPAGNGLAPARAAFGPY